MQTNDDGAALLRVLLDRLEWSPEQLARDVNRLAGENLISTKAPYGWLRGSVPRGRTAQLAALAISKALGETVTVGVLWPGARGRGVAVAAHHGLDLPWDADGAVRCAELVAQPTANSLLAATGPMLVTCAVDWLTTSLITPPTRPKGEPLSDTIITILRDRVAQLRVSTTPSKAQCCSSGSSATSAGPPLSPRQARMISTRARGYSVSSRNSVSLPAGSPQT